MEHINGFYITLQEVPDLVFNLNVYIFVGSDGTWPLAERAYMTAVSSMTARTWHTRVRITKEYMAFNIFQRVSKPHELAPLLSYVQHLVEMGLTYWTINNYGSALKNNLERLGFLVSSIEHCTFRAYLKALSRKNPRK